MTVSQLTDNELLTQTSLLISQERRLTLEILHHLQEIERRRLHLSLGYSSLFTFCVSELRYSESQAYRRIQAMRALREVPEIEKSLEKGNLTIASVSQIQSFCAALKKEGTVMSKNDKKELFQVMESKSKRETEKILLSLSPNAIPQEKLRALDEARSELKLVLSEELLVKLNQIKSLISHKNPSSSYLELIEYLVNFTLEKLDPAKKSQKSDSTSPGKQPNQSDPSVIPSRAIPAHIRREVWRRSHGQCSYQDPNTKRRCQSTYQLEVDHVLPVAKGGRHELENLRLLCKSHNLHAAVKVFGADKINKHIGS